MKNITKKKSTKTAMSIISAANKPSQDKVDFVAKVQKNIEKGVLIDGGKININPHFFELDNENREFDINSLGFLALLQSLKEEGLLQPIVFTFNSASLSIELVAGHRRLEAAKQLGWVEIAAIYKDDIARKKLQRFSENAFREDLSPIEYCKHLKEIKNYLKPDSIVNFANSMGITRDKCTGCLKIADWHYKHLDLADENKISLTKLIKIAIKSTDKTDVGLELKNAIEDKKGDGRRKLNRDKNIENKPSEKEALIKSSLESFYQEKNVPTRLQSKINSLSKFVMKINDQEKELIKAALDVIKI